MKINLKWILAISALVLCLAVAGCTQPTPEEAEAQFCTDMAGLETALQELESTDETATVGEVRAAQDNVTEAWSNVRNSAQTLEDVNVDQLETAYNDLDSAVQGLPDDITVQEAKTSLQPQIDALKQSWQQVSTAANCG
jgi:outer membrane murein-binding lipoprotein Lpp